MLSKFVSDSKVSDKYISISDYSIVMATVTKSRPLNNCVLSDFVLGITERLKLD